MTQNKQKILAIVGPTCTGKTFLGINLCKKYHGKIVSADSRQIVKGFDIGTGKFPQNMESPKNLVWGYDLVLPSEFFSAFDFKLQGEEMLSQLLSEGVNPVVVGGTGFYVDALLRNTTFSSVPPNLEVRNKLLRMSQVEQLQKLKELSLEKFNSIDKKNSARVTRALEILLSDKSKTVQDKKSQNYDILWIGLTSTNDHLFKRADYWLDSIWNEKFFDEVTKLQKDKSDLAQARLNGFIYKEVTTYLEGDLSKEDALQKAKFSIHAYIRRQKTWFKRYLDIQWFDVSKDNYETKVYNLADTFYG